MVEMGMAEEDVGAGVESGGGEFVAEEANSGARVADDQMRSAADFDA